MVSASGLSVVGSHAGSRCSIVQMSVCVTQFPYSVLLLGILKKGPDPAGTFKKWANQNISGPHRAVFFTCP